MNAPASAPPPTSGPSLGESSWIAAAADAVRARWRRLLRRLPRLVWVGQEVDVRVTFSLVRLNDLGVDADGLFKAEEHLRGIGLSFDAGCGFGGRDWEWDYSLVGPVTVTFKGVNRRAALAAKIGMRM